MNDKTSHILERFPGKKDNISRLMSVDPEFLAMCEDYEACVNALQFWSKSKDPEAENRISEYRNIVKELEDEVAQALQLLK